MSGTSLKVIFAGTPEFAAASLQALVDGGYDVVMVLTQPDRPAGRGRKVEASPVKLLAEDHGLPVWQPVGLRDRQIQQRLHDLNADIMIVAAYGLILPAAVLQIPRLGCINVHASLLPRWRGAAPIQQAILAGDRETGITIIAMDEGLDTGDMLLKHSCPVLDDDTAGSLHDRLASLGAETLLEALALLVSNNLQPVAQDPAQACYAGKVDKRDACIDWRQAADFIARQIRAYNPWPVAYTTLTDGRRLRIWQARVLDATSHEQPGTVLGMSREGFNVACGEGVLQLRQMQLPGGRQLMAADLINAPPLAVGEKLVSAGSTEAGHVSPETPNPSSA